MYSKNDYRYYLENQLTYSDDYLAHYGVKGMKWKQHQRSKLIDPRLRKLNQEWYNTQIDQERGKQRTSDQYQKYIRQEQNRGYKRTVREHIKVEQEKGKKRTAQLKSSPEYKKESSYNSKKNNFPKSTVSEPKKKKTLKQKAAGLRKKYGLYREKPKGKSIGGGITVSHKTVIK